MWCWMNPFRQCHFGAILASQLLLNTCVTCRTQQDHFINTPLEALIYSAIPVKTLEDHALVAEFSNTG